MPTDTNLAAAPETTSGGGGANGTSAITAADFPVATASAFSNMATFASSLWRC
jgi:hypothetical protein